MILCTVKTTIYQYRDGCYVVTGDMKHEMCLKCSDNWKEQFYSVNSEAVCVFKAKEKAVAINPRTGHAFITLPKVHLPETL